MADWMSPRDHADVDALGRSTGRHAAPFPAFFVWHLAAGDLALNISLSLSASAPVDLVGAFAPIEKSVVVFFVSSDGSWTFSPRDDFYFNITGGIKRVSGTAPCFTTSRIPLARRTCASSIRSIQLKRTEPTRARSTFTFRRRGRRYPHGPSPHAVLIAAIFQMIPSLPLRRDAHDAAVGP